MNLNFYRDVIDLLIVKKIDTFIVIVSAFVKKIDMGATAARSALLLPFIFVCIL
jgi:hypothetical protein